VDQVDLVSSKIESEGFKVFTLFGSSSIRYVSIPGAPEVLPSSFGHIFFLLFKF
jgi:hypothetical protein